MLNCGNFKLCFSQVEIFDYVRFPRETMPKFHLQSWPLFPLFQGKRTFEISKWARYRLDVENTTGSVTYSEEFRSSLVILFVWLQLSFFKLYLFIIILSLKSKLGYICQSFFDTACSLVDAQQIVLILLFGKVLAFHSITYWQVIVFSLHHLHDDSIQAFHSIIFLATKYWLFTP